MNMPAAIPSTPAVFQFNSAAIRTFADDQGESWFAAADVCDVLGYMNSRDAVAKHCRSYGVAKRDTIDSMGREQEITVINEPNLYRLIIKSRKPEAEKFEGWVMEVVLPALRKHGRYELESGHEAEPPRIAPDRHQRILASERQRRYRQRKNEGGWHQVTRWARDGDPISTPQSGLRVLIKIDQNGRQTVENIPEDAHIIRLKDLHELIAAQGLRLVADEDLRKLKEAASHLLGA